MLKYEKLLDFRKFWTRRPPITQLIKHPSGNGYNIVQLSNIQHDHQNKFSEILKYVDDIGVIGRTQFYVKSIFHNGDKTKNIESWLPDRTGQARQSTKFCTSNKKITVEEERRIILARLCLFRLNRMSFQLSSKMKVKLYMKLFISCSNCSFQQ